MNTLQRFLTSTVNACIPKKIYTVSEVKQKLLSEIFELERWFLNAEPDTKAWREKSALMKIKRENLNEVIKEETHARS